MPTRILIVGGGGREHAIAWKLGSEPGVNLVVVAPGSDAIAAEPRTRVAPDFDPLDADGLVALARAHAIELAVVGPEAPLAAGVADTLRSAGVAVFGPSRAAARIESSKTFCREIAEAAGVRMARGASLAELAPAAAFASQIAADGRGVVVKADGLAAGKGVTVCDDAAAAEDALERIFDMEREGATGVPGDDPAARVVVEERIIGREASVIALTDGRDCLALPAARDHKRLLDGDRGPNTGGMGAYSPLPDLPDELAANIVETVHRPILAELARRGVLFVGALYAGLMLTADGPVLLECNARFGDPETQVILPRLPIPLGPLLLACARGRLAPAVDALGIQGPLAPAGRGAAVGIVLAAGSYPEAAGRGDRIEGLEEAARGSLVFHSGTRHTDAGDDTNGYETNGGRILTVVGRSPDLEAARQAAEAAADALAFDGMQRRHDIAADVPAPLGHSDPAAMDRATAGAR
ncbi:MAG TPA: phosphoribosylamine--glycine ligase [Candidatus Acidoferrum sp.]|nr:phosphoribosylamine--glycine ligase [Candidatus Acidoferrum sp.]